VTENPTKNEDEDRGRDIALTRTTKRVPARELPHSSEKLSKTTNEEAHADDHVRFFHSAGLDIDEGKQERCTGKGEQATSQRSTSILEALLKY